MIADAKARLILPDGSIHQIQANCLIGRSSSNQLVLKDAGVSRRHALINQQGESGYWIVELGSSNGTKLNDRQVIQPMPLNDGDRIRIGSATLVFEAGGPPSATETIAASTCVNIRTTRQWLLFADIEGFTPMSQKLAPDELAKTIGGWFESTRGIVNECGGGIHKYLGDGWLASWEDNAGAERRVARCIEALAKLRERGKPPFRTILHLGDVTSSGSIASSDLGMMGPDVNFLFRMEKICASLGKPMLLSKAAAQRIAPNIPCESVGSHSLKGFPDKHEFFA